MPKLCTKCRFELREDWNICPECGKPIYGKLKELKRIKAKTKSIGHKLTDKIWILTFIAGIIGFLALFTPASTVSVSYSGVVLISMDSWLFGLNIFYVYGEGYDIFFTGNQYLLGVEIFSLVVLGIINIILIASSLWIRKDVEEMPVDIIHIYFAIGLVIGTLIFILGNEVIFWLFFRDTYWGFTNLGFALIGQYIAALITVISYGIGKRYYYSPELSI